MSPTYLTITLSYLIIIWFACAGLTGCGATTPAPLSALPNTPTRSPGPDTLTPTLTETSTLLPTRTPTPTLLPTAPPTLTPVPSATEAAAPTLTPSAEPAPETATLTPIPATATPADTPTVAVEPTSAQTNYVRQLLTVPTSPETLIALTDNGRLLRSTTGGLQWDMVYTGEQESKPRAIGVDYQPPHTLYLLTGQGLYRSSDYGDTFEFVHSLTGTAISVSFENAAHLWVGESDEPMLKSEDGGQQWRSARIGLSAYRVASPILINPRDSNMLLVITQGQRGGAALYRGTREGAWTGLPGLTWLVPTGPNPIGLAWDSNRGIVYTGDADGKLYRSLNVEALDQTTVTWEVSYDFGVPHMPVPLAMGEGPALYLTLYDYEANGGPLLRGTQDEAGGWLWQEIGWPE